MVFIKKAILKPTNLLLIMATDDSYIIRIQSVVEWTIETVDSGLICGRVKPKSIKIDNHSFPA